MVGRGKQKQGARGRGKGRGKGRIILPTTCSPSTPPSQETQQSDTESVPGSPSSPSNDRDISPLSCPQPTKKSKLISNLSEEQEENMIEWIAEHPQIYNTKMSQYKDTKSKIALWEAKARELGLDYASIQTWYKSPRIRYGKLKLRKSGDGAAELTDREKWVLQKFAFLDGHIHRVKSKPLVSLRAKIAGDFGESADDDLDAVTLSSDDEGSANGTAETSDTVISKSTSDRHSRLSKGKSKLKSRSIDDEDNLLRKMTGEWSLPVNFRRR